MTQKLPNRNLLFTALTAAALLTALLTALTACNQQQPTTSDQLSSDRRPTTNPAAGPASMEQDLAARSRDTSWPAEFDPAGADLVAHNELRVNAPCADVWRLLVEAPRWPDHYPNARNIDIVGGGNELANDTVFRWTTFGLDIESRVVEFEANRRLGWYGYPPGEEPAFFHRWLLTPAGSGCQVVTEEAGIGPGARQIRETDETLIHRGHDVWLAGIKWRAEEGS